MPRACPGLFADAGCTMQSYAGKYVPSISHYIVQAEAMADGTADKLKKTRDLPQNITRPVFKLGGLAIGNGFTGECSSTGSVCGFSSQWLQNWLSKSSGRCSQVALACFEASTCCCVCHRTWTLRIHAAGMMQDMQGNVTQHWPPKGATQPWGRNKRGAVAD